jgi:hypothetical protein
METPDQNDLARLAKKVERSDLRPVVHHAPDGFALG